MSPEDLDRVDMGILHCLQGDARNVTTSDIGERLGMAASTVATRLSRLEDEGVVTGYWPSIDHHAIGYGQHLLVVGTTTEDADDDVLDAVADVTGVVRATELMVDEGDVVVEIVAQSQDEIEERGETLTDLGVEIVRTEVVEEQVVQPFDGFGEGVTDDD